MAITLNINVAGLPGDGGGEGPPDPPPTGGSGTSVTTTAIWQGVTFTLSTACTVGYLADGKPFFVDPGSAVTVSWSPGTTTAGGLVVNGGMKNPNRTLQQGWDARETTSFNEAARVVSGVVTLRANDSLVVQTHNSSPNTSGGGTTLHPVFSLAFSAIICLAAEPAANSYIPATGPYVNGGTARPVYVFDVTTITFPSYTISSAIEDMATITARLARFNPLPAQTRAVEPRRKLTPSGFTTSDGYGHETVDTMNKAAVRLIGNDSTATKRVLAKHIMMHFAEWYPAVKASATLKWFADGAQNQGLVLPCILALGWMGDTASLGTLLTDVRSNELDGTFRIDADYLNRVRNPHNTVSTAWPQLTLRRTIASITGTGPWTITFTDAITGGWISVWPGNVLVRESGAASSGQANVINSISSAKQQVIDTHPSPAFQVGDVCYNRAGYTQIVGDAEWTLKGLTRFDWYDPAPDASYIDLNKWAGEVMCVQAFGFTHSAWNHWRDYVARCNAQTNPATPYTYQKQFRSNAEETFWTTHWPAISAVTQTVG